MRHFCSFSEAIREGVKLSPRQAFYVFFGDGSSCAIGAGMEAILGERPSWTEIQKRWDELAEVFEPYRYMSNTAEMPCGCAVLDEGFYERDSGERSTQPTLQNIATHLNNKHQWTRERIADWLETEEEKLGFVTLYESESESSSPVDTQVVSL